MAFINGKFYMNPAYGRALETRRAAESVRQSGRDSSRARSQPSIASRSGNHAPDRRSEIQYPASEHERKLAVIIFNETGGLSASTKSGNGSAANLHESRVAVGEVSNRVIQSGHANRVAPDEIETGLWEGLNSHNPASVGAWNDPMQAARTVARGSNITDGANHFRLDSKNGKVPLWASGTGSSATYGPFHNAGGGDASVPTTEIHIYH